MADACGRCSGKGWHWNGQRRMTCRERHTPDHATFVSRDDWPALKARLLGEVDVTCPDCGGDGGRVEETQECCGNVLDTGECCAAAYGTAHVIFDEEWEQCPSCAGTGKVRVAA